MRVISLGWGVQSFTLAAMAALGYIKPVDAVIHADTTHERSATYEFARRWSPWLEERAVPVVVVQPARNKLEQFHGKQMVYIPAYTTDGESKGQLKRQCTSEWKVAPIRRWLQANRHGQRVTMLLGISQDEWHRAKDSQVQYVTHEYPLLDKSMTRNDCMNWLEARGLEIPRKSACTFCPYHNRREWREIRNDAEDWAQAVQVDEAIRKRRPPFDVFVHVDRMPLAHVDMSTPEDHGQLRLINEECDSGYCWL